jgi:hypothetical protein
MQLGHLNQGSRFLSLFTFFFPLLLVSFKRRILKAVVKTITSLSFISVGLFVA